MSLDRSLKTSSAMGKHRNVLTRAERIAKLKEQGRFAAGEQDPIHLPKVTNRRVAAGKKAGPKKEGGEEAAGKGGKGGKGKK